MTTKLVETSHLTGVRLVLKSGNTNRRERAAQLIEVAFLVSKRVGNIFNFQSRLSKLKLVQGGPFR
jgi:hypothetical protein